MHALIELEMRKDDAVVGECAVVLVKYLAVDLRTKRGRLQQFRPLWISAILSVKQQLSTVSSHPQLARLSIAYIVDETESLECSGRLQRVAASRTEAPLDCGVHDGDRMLVGDLCELTRALDGGLQVDGWIARTPLARGVRGFALL